VWAAFNSRAAVADPPVAASLFSEPSFGSTQPSFAIEDGRDAACPGGRISGISIRPDAGVIQPGVKRRPENYSNPE